MKYRSFGERIPSDIGCVNTKSLPATLLSTNGYHCDVWQTTGTLMRGAYRSELDLVVKRYREPCTVREIQVFNQEYRELRRRLRHMVPPALFLASRVDGEVRAVVVARAVYPWFNLANPGNEEEAVPLLRLLGKAQRQLKRFIDAARQWYEEDEVKIIDLFGLDNLVLDRNRNIKYVDSFRVFFYEDLLTILPEVDTALKDRIDVSLRRLQYLEYVLREATILRLAT